MVVAGALKHGPPTLAALGRAESLAEPTRE